MAIRPYENSAHTKAAYLPSMESLKSWRGMTLGSKFSSKDDMDMRLLCLAAYHDTCTIINFIYQNNSKALNLGDQDGWTPLFCAARYNTLDAALAMLQLGADPNVATIRAVELDIFELDRYKLVPTGSTSLWVAAQVTHNVSMTTLLLKYGAVATLQFDEKGQKILKAAQKKLDEERNPFFASLEISLHILSKPLLQIIADYLLNNSIDENLSYQ